MNISADGIIGNAQQINRKRELARGENRTPQPQGRADSVEISTQLRGRLEELQQNFRTTQNSLSQNQVIQDGLNKLLEDIRSGGNNQERILADVQYNRQPVLADFLGDRSITEEGIAEGIVESRQMIQHDLGQLSRLQVETENIFATNLIPNTADLSSHISDSNQNPESISRLDADVVRRLTQ